MKKTIVIAVAGVLALSSSIVIAGPMHGPDSEIKQMLRSLDLTREQKQDIRKLIQEHRQDVALTRTGEPGRNGMWQQQTSFDEDTFRANLAARTTTIRTQRFERAELRHTIYQLLTSEQRNALEQQDIERHQKRSAKREKHDENRLPRAFGRLSLTDDQKETLISLQTGYSDASANNRALMKAFRTKEKALIRSDKFSEETWNALADEYQQDMTDAMVAHAEHKASMLSVLDDNQRQALFAMRDERKDRHDRGKPHRR